MTTPQKNSMPSADDSPSATLDALRQLCSQQPDNEQAWVARGKAAWQLGLRAEAITAYNTAVALNPDSPARILLEQANGIMDFFCTDFFNP